MNFAIALSLYTTYYSFRFPLREDKTEINPYIGTFLFFPDLLDTRTSHIKRKIGCKPFRFFLLFIFYLISHDPDFFKSRRQKASKNIVGKGENAGTQYFLLFLQCFLPLERHHFMFSVKFDYSTANTFNFDNLKICRLVKG